MFEVLRSIFGTHGYVGSPLLDATTDLRHSAMMLGVMEGFYCREVCFRCLVVGSHIGGAAIVSLRLALVRVVLDVCFPYFYCVGPFGSLSAPLVSTAATDSTMWMALSTFPLSVYLTSCAGPQPSSRRERRELRLRLKIMPIRSDCDMPRYLS